MDIAAELQKLNMSEEEYEQCLLDIQDKLDGVSDLDWEEIRAKYNIHYAADVIRKANGTPFGGYMVKKYLDSKRPVTCGDSRIYDIRKEKQKLFDERAALNKIKREEARLEEDIDKIRELIAQTGKEKYQPVAVKHTDTGTDLIICLSDLHVGQDIDSFTGKYNSDIAKERLDDYLSEIVDIATRNNTQNAYVFLMGDLISGNIHLTTQLENRENAVEQVVKASEMVADFLYALSEHFDTVYVNDVSGNHSRINLKENVLRGERLDSLVPWYLKAKLQHIPNIQFESPTMGHYDATIGYVVIRGKEYWMVHGDFDGFDQSGVAKLVLMIGHSPEGIFFGHMHNNAYQCINDINIIRSGSLCGTGDDYTMSKRIQGSPSQMVVVANDRGVKSLNPVTLS